MRLQFLVSSIRQQYRRTLCSIARRHIVYRVSYLQHNQNRVRSFSSETKHTMIKLCALSAKPQASAMCKIPAGSGLGGRNCLVTMGEKIFPGRNFCSRCITGPLCDTCVSDFRAISSSLSFAFANKLRLPRNTLLRAEASRHETHSKFLVHSAILTALFSKYSMSSVSPGCGS